MEKQNQNQKEPLVRQSNQSYQINNAAKAENLQQLIYNQPANQAAPVKPNSQGSSQLNANPYFNQGSARPSYYSPYVPKKKTPEYIAFKNRVISVKGLAITILSIIFCILFTETIFFGAAGISVPIMTIAFEGILFYSFKEKEKALSKTGVYTAVPIILLAMSFFIHYNPSTQFITWLTIIGLFCIQIISLSDIRVNGIFTLDMFIKAIENLFARPFSNFIVPFNSFKLLKNTKSKNYKNTIYILIGLMLSIPIAAILMVLFMSADAVFAVAMENITDFLGLDFKIIFWDIVLGTIFGILLAAMLTGLKYNEEKQASPAKIGDNIEAIIVGTFLTIINIFIITFVAFQFVYLFGGTVNITASDMTYAEYARRGFFELSTASGIIFAIALFVLIMTKKKDGRLSLWIKLATVCLCLCDGVLLISAVKRMLLYVNVYGLSTKRTLTLWFMAIIGLCLLWIIVKCYAIKIDVMKWIGITVIIGVCILSLTNTERIIANYNVNRYLEGTSETYIDINYLGNLSYTVVPEVARLMDLDKKHAGLKSIMESQQYKLSHRHRIYGFTLDQIKVSAILDKKLN
ncbi:uncharacterized protein DUF4173 [Ruminiclostridium sufflavum DSM 19573]|uniref:Uncharacterized protein DUF4173 n=1 Tax=Ruminiclostridium sufflavum DSM 19573 TaxID=1121337 RepID=A0A318XIX4_9FIRM|nr:DUF4173 domain-containing protein [Ruminiclostridium sufflavum]PYG87135.1 uncharacterized protein DUF4173 [Ruminiclostridium sufflavum DSM 19573]